MLFQKKKKLPAPDRAQLPRHIAVVMDGNGRWAQKRGMPRTFGHSAGSETFQKDAEYLSDLGIEYFTVYAFSTENWKRPPEEVQEILRLLEKYLHKAIREMREKNIRLQFFGDLTPFSQELRALIDETNAISRTTTGMLVSVCLNYGGRAELVRAARLLAEQCVAGTLRPEEIDEARFSGCLYSADIPDPDLMIRPGGEMRLSNFLLWQNAYTEFYFSDVLWPDFDQRQMDAAILAYQQRKRRFGGI